MDKTLRVYLNHHFSLLSDFWVSLNSGNHCPCMLANTLYLCCTCIRPGAYSHLMNELGSSMRCETCKGANKKIQVSAVPSPAICTLVVHIFLSFRYLFLGNVLEPQASNQLRNKTETYELSSDCYFFFFFFFFFLSQFYVPFKIISAHMRRANQ